MSAPAPLRAEAPAERWWIEADGRVWGPYPAERLAGFRTEGRLGAASLVARAPDGPFQPAALAPELAALFPEAAEAPAPAPALGIPAPASPAAALPAARALLVMTDAQEAACAGVEASLGAHGAFVSVRPGLWLVRAREGAASLRNALSRRLRGADTLLVLEAPLSAAAWFNLDGATDRALRRLWAEPAEAETDG